MNTNFDHLTDEQVLSLISKGEESAMDYLLGKYFAVVKRLVMNYYMTGGEQEDLHQEGYIGLFKAIRSYDPKKNNRFYPYAKMCIESQIQTAVTASNRKKHAPLNLSVPIEFSPEQEMATLTGNPEKIFLDKEWEENAEKKMEEKLSPFEKTVVLLYLEGKTYAEIATEIGKTPKSIDNAISRVKKKLSETR
ncbi:MAG: sigma-70 family RNA polymerase sigma factor [Lachnospiraceae bacterium]|nr:sigma-70 family RNA polymerase sigma factor [Lachnospiraceae bacterium]